MILTLPHPDSPSFSQSLGLLPKSGLFDSPFWQSYDLARVHSVHSPTCEDRGELCLQLSEVYHHN